MTIIANSGITAGDMRPGSADPTATDFTIPTGVGANGTGIGSQLSFVDSGSILPVTVHDGLGAYGHSLPASSGAATFAEKVIHEALVHGPNPQISSEDMTQSLTNAIHRQRPGGRAITH